MEMKLLKGPFDKTACIACDACNAPVLAFQRKYLKLAAGSAKNVWSIRWITT